MSRQPENVKKRIKTAISGINMGGMYILCGAFCILALVLVLVQANVQYSMRGESLDLLPREELIRLKSGLRSYSADYINDTKVESVSSRDNNCLLLLEAEEPTSYKAKKLYIPILDQMKESFDVCEVIDFDPKDLDKYDRIVLAITNYQKLKESIADIKAWVKDGGNLMIAYPPVVTGSFETFYDILGIKNCGDATMVEGLHFNRNFMLGSKSHDYPIIDAYDCSLGLALTDDCDVYIESTDKYAVPLVWRRNVEKGSIVVDNFGIMEKAYRGIHGAAYSLLGDACIYPVINGAAFYIDDFPSPVPEGDGTYISRDYNMSVSDFYSQVWWNNVYELGEEHNIRYTGLVIENYSNQVEGKFERNTDTDRFKYYGNMLLRSGGEIGIHGYNHMPLVLENFDYKDQYDSYIQWPTEQDMRGSLDEVFDFTKQLFPEEELQVYVPPSNVLSKEGRKLLGKTSIRSIGAVYLNTELAYEQEFNVSSEDGIINTPRITSGCLIDEYMELAAMSELNFHFVNTHFLHPDDVLDEDRGAALGWETLLGNLKKYLDWLYKSCPAIRNLTGSELAAAVQRYDLLGVKRHQRKDGLEVNLKNFNDEAWMFLRLNKGQNIKEIYGGGYEKVAENLYLVKCDSRVVKIDYE